MRNSLLSIACGAALAVVSLVSCSQAQQFAETVEVGPYTVSLISANVWHVEDCNSSRPAGNFMNAEGKMQNNNCSDMYIITGKDKSLLIDLSNDIKWADNAAESLQQIFEERSLGKQKVITITHNHGDHTGMLHAFKDDASISYLLPEDDFAKDNKFPQPKTLINDGSVIDLGGGMILDCIKVQGHTPGSIVFSLRGKDAMFSGDAIGSGGGVWIFNMAGFKQYVDGVANLVKFVDDPANKINQEKLTFYGGHDWQKLDMPKLDINYLRDMSTLVEKICKGEAEYEPYRTMMGYLNANFKYGCATVTWNKEDSEKLVSAE